MTKPGPHFLTALPKDFENGSILFSDRPSSRPRPVSFCAAFLPETDGGFQSLPHPKPVENRASNDGNAQLTARELEVLTAMADGATNKAIARRLGISFHTVKFHVAAILEKLDADTRTEAVMKAAQLGIVML